MFVSVYLCWVEYLNKNQVWMTNFLSVEVQKPHSFPIPCRPINKRWDQTVSGKLFTQSKSHMHLSCDMMSKHKYKHSQSINWINDHINDTKPGYIGNVRNRNWVIRKTLTQIFANKVNSCKLQHWHLECFYRHSRHHHLKGKVEVGIASNKPKRKMLLV